MPATKLRRQRNEDEYLDLVTAFPLRPIRSKEGHRQALLVLRDLAGKRGGNVADYKTVLISLIVQYERDAG
jgi:hypothetical protein